MRLDEATSRVEKLEGEKRRLEEELEREKKKKKEEEATARRAELETYVRTLDVQAAAEQEEREIWLREVAGIRSVERTQAGVRLSKETYDAWELEIQSLKEQVRKAKELLIAAEELPKARGQVIATVCHKSYAALGRMKTTAPSIEIDEMLGLATLRAILSEGEVNKRLIQPSDWDVLWE